MTKCSFRACLILLCFFYVANAIFSQQEDSLQLDFSELNWKDIRSSENLLESTKVISGSRSEKEVADLPFTIMVITGEEIRANGYLTLADVLKRLPGIRVSQPGSALEGETFLMRGLLGNTYAKILINDLPIKPFLVSGMPIGAQLPIREAERIEVIYGPAATIYGVDASAGIINIILKDSERPIYLQADLGFGGDKFTNLDIMFSGKLGKDKKVLKFQVFGNFTSFNDRRIKYELDSLYNPITYQNIFNPGNFSYLDRPNYSGTAEEPQLGELPHLSNALGIDLRYRNWQLSIQRYYRRDHSSIGLSPYAVSYANPLNYFGEEINNFHLNYSKTKNRFQLKTSLSVLGYGTDSHSSYSYVIPFFNYIQQVFAEEILGNGPPLDSLRKVIDDLYFSGTRYSSALSGEGRIEVLTGFQFNEKFELTAGLNLQGGGGTPLRNYSPVPLNYQDDSIIIERIIIDEAYYFDFSSFVEGYLNIGKWNIIAGTQIFNRFTDYSDINRFIMNPRLAIQYRWTDQFSLRASTGRSYRYPSPYYSATTYLIDVNNIGQVNTGANLSPERTLSAEFGSRWSSGTKVSGDASFYYTRTNDFIRYALIPAPDSNGYISGYFNDNSAYAELFGIQSSISFKDILPSIGLSCTFNVNYALGKEGFSAYSFQDFEFLLIELDELRSQPKWIAQLDIELKPFKKVRFLLENTFLTRSLTQNTLFYQFPDLVADSNLYNPGYYTLDLMVNYEFNRQLLAYLKFTNFFNAEYAGLDATPDADGLIYNPQSKRFLRFGVNYRLE